MPIPYLKHAPTAGAIVFVVCLFFSIPVGIFAVLTDSWVLVMAYCLICAVALGAMFATLVQLRQTDTAASSFGREFYTPCCDKLIVGRKSHGQVEPAWPIAFNEFNGVLQCHACGTIYVPESDDIALDPDAPGSPGYLLWHKHGGGIDESDNIVRLGKLKQKNEEARGE